MKSLMYIKKGLYLKEVLHNNLEAYMSSGYGGSPIIDWPFYKFISMWVSGRTVEAKQLWVDWLLREFDVYGAVSKSRGGMYQGSVHRNSCNYYGEDDCVLKWRNPEKLDRAALYHGALDLVERRIQMIDSIREYGWGPDLSDRIYAVEVGPDRYILKGGHHRAATLFALGYDVLPNVYVYSKLGWRLLRWMKVAKKLLCLKIQGITWRG